MISPQEGGERELGMQTEKEKATATTEAIKSHGLCRDGDDDDDQSQLNGASARPGQ